MYLKILAGGAGGGSSNKIPSNLTIEPVCSNVNQTNIYKLAALSEGHRARNWI